MYVVHGVGVCLGEEGRERDGNCCGESAWLGLNMSAWVKAMGPCIPCEFWHWNKVYGVLLVVEGVSLGVGGSIHDSSQTWDKWESQQ